MSDNSAYLEYTEEKDAPQVNLSELQQLAEKQALAEAEVARCVAALEVAKNALREIAEGSLPTAMDAAGIPEFRTTSGLMIKVKETIRASIPKNREREAFSWLRENKHEKMIKRAISVAFGTGDDEQANKLITMIAQTGLEVEDKSSVHPSTLSSFVKEKLEKGEPVPLDLFGVFRQRAAQIEVPKK